MRLLLRTTYARISRPPTLLVCFTILVFVLLIGATSCAVAWAETFKLINGDKLSGRLVERTPDELILDHPVLGRLAIPVSALKLPQTTPGLFSTSLLKGWDKELDLGLNGNQGNGDMNNVSVGLDLSYADDKQRWKISGQ